MQNKNRKNKLMIGIVLGLFMGAMITPALAGITATTSTVSGNASVGGDLTVTGDVTANLFTGDGSGLTGITVSGLNAAPSLQRIYTSENVSYVATYANIIDALDDNDGTGENLTVWLPTDGGFTGTSLITLGRGDHLKCNNANITYTGTGSVFEMQEISSLEDLTIYYKGSNIGDNTPIIYFDSDPADEGFDHPHNRLIRGVSIVDMDVPAGGSGGDQSGIGILMYPNENSEDFARNIIENCYFMWCKIGIGLFNDNANCYVNGNIVEKCGFVGNSYGIVLNCTANEISMNRFIDCWVEAEAIGDEIHGALLIGNCYYNTFDNFNVMDWSLQAEGDIAFAINGTTATRTLVTSSSLSMFADPKYVDNTNTTAGSACRNTLISPYGSFMQDPVFENVSIMPMIGSAIQGANIDKEGELTFALLTDREVPLLRLYYRVNATTYYVDFTS